jgi:hypothetical protein
VLPVIKKMFRFLFKKVNPSIEVSPDVYEGLRQRFNNLRTLHNTKVQENDALKSELDLISRKYDESQNNLNLLKPYVGSLFSLVSEGWPKVLSGIRDSIDLSKPPHHTLIYLRSLLDSYEIYVVSSEHDRSDEIAIMFLIGAATYEYIRADKIDTEKSIELLNLMVQYLNANSEYGLCEQHGLSKHYDERFHTCDQEVYEMDKVQMRGFLIKDKSNNNILKKAIAFK